MLEAPPSLEQGIAPVSDDSNLIKEKLQKVYLPQLIVLKYDCSLLMKKLEIDVNKTDLRPNEMKLLQFLTMIDSVIQDTEKVRDNTSSGCSTDSEGSSTDDEVRLLAKIEGTIMPIKHKMNFQ